MSEYFITDCLLVLWHFSVHVIYQSSDHLQIGFAWIIHGIEQIGVLRPDGPLALTSVWDTHLIVRRSFQCELKTTSSSVSRFNQHPLTKPVRPWTPRSALYLRLCLTLELIMASLIQRLNLCDNGVMVRLSPSSPAWEEWFRGAFSVGVKPPGWVNKCSDITEFPFTRLSCVCTPAESPRSPPELMI